MTIKEEHYFACANTSMGFQNLYESNLEGLNKCYNLYGVSSKYISKLLTAIAKYYENDNNSIEFIHCPANPDMLEGIIIRDKKVAILDGNRPYIIQMKNESIKKINIGIPTLSKEKSPNNIDQINNTIKQLYSKAYMAFNNAIKIHDEWEKIYIENMDFKKANELTEKYINVLFTNCKKHESGTIRHRFFGGSTPNGAINYVTSLTKDIKNRYFIKGRPGSGKSTMLKQMVNKAESLNLDAEVYHCGFDPKSLDMLLIPELDLCIFDSTSPHEYYPNRKNDNVIDMYTELITPGTDEKYKDELLNIQSRYKALINTGTSYLKEISKLDEELYNINLQNIDKKKCTLIIDNLVKQISSM